jgi:hypothetical protein
VKRLAVLFVVALASAAVTYFLVSLRAGGEASAAGGLSWMKTEFALSDEQFAAVRELHDEYSGRCAQHCADILAARRALQDLPANADDGQRATALTRISQLEAICNEATRAHLRRVAEVMPPGRAERFLRMIEPHLAQQPHDGNRGLIR